MIYNGSDTLKKKSRNVGIIRKNEDLEFFF